MMKKTQMRVASFLMLTIASLFLVAGCNSSNKYIDKNRIVNEYLTFYDYDSELKDSLFLSSNHTYSSICKENYTLESDYLIYGEIDTTKYGHKFSFNKSVLREYSYVTNGINTSYEVFFNSSERIMTINGSPFVDRLGTLKEDSVVLLFSSFMYDSLNVEVMINEQPQSLVLEKVPWMPFLYQSGYKKREVKTNLNILCYYEDILLRSYNDSISSASE